MVVRCYRWIKVEKEEKVKQVKRDKDSSKINLREGLDVDTKREVSS